MINQYKYTNKLINESSPYLLQHAHNPVKWYPWGKEAFEKAKKENKLVIISIGYAACHWCHVMEEECFEDEDVAAFMNENFVAIKVDREERPDIDQIYMNAVQLIRGSGGWPLNCITLPDGRPLYGGTYFPKEQWIEMLTQVLNFVEQSPEKAEQQAKSLTLGIQNTEPIYKSSETPDFSLEDLNEIFVNWKSQMDTINGGHKGSPKFPLPIAYQYLLNYYHLSKNSQALEAVNLSLDKMAMGGIYDQIGGGFARYSTDSQWKVPHFEKMLYDNAQLISLYSMAYQQNKKEDYKRIVKESLKFIERELTSAEGGFYSSLDADSEGKEGKYYVWTKAEIESILGKNAPLILDYYSATQEGNWEKGQNILYKKYEDAAFAEKNNISEAELQNRILEAKNLLLKVRKKRIPPALDDKILTSWNGLMLKAYCDAYRAFNEDNYLDFALKSAHFIRNRLLSPDGRLDRNYKNGKSSINGFLDDYAFTIDAFIALYQVTFDEMWLLLAKQLADYTLLHFYDLEKKLFYYTSDIDPALIARKIELSDNVIPAANSQMAKNLFMLGQYFYKDDYIQKSKAMLNGVKQNTLKGGQYYANWDILMVWFVDEPFEVVILGDDIMQLRKEFNKYYLPNVFLSGGSREGSVPLLENRLVSGKKMIYVCKNKVCQFPVSTVKDALLQIFTDK